jgi:hypothetical protein
MVSKTSDLMHPTPALLYRIKAQYQAAVLATGLFVSLLALQTSLVLARTTELSARLQLQQLHVVVVLLPPHPQVSAAWVNQSR